MKATREAHLLVLVLNRKMQALSEDEQKTRFIDASNESNPMIQTSLIISLTNHSQKTMQTEKWKVSKEGGKSWANLYM